MVGPEAGAEWNPLQQIGKHILVDRRFARAQKFSDRFCSLDWPRLLKRYAKKINPLMTDLLKNMPYYWVTAQSEYSTDILFKSAADLNKLYPRLLSHSTLCFGAKEVMSFL